MKMRGVGGRGVPGGGVAACLSVVGVEFWVAGAADVRGRAGDVRVLGPVDAVFGEHRIAFIGGNGSGKSTLAKLLAGVIAPSRGGVFGGGATGFVFTDPRAGFVMPTVLEDVALSLRSLYRGRAERFAAAVDVLERVGLGGLASRSVYSLSGGEGQLLAIAGALAGDPVTVVADEPTTLLDLRNSCRVEELLFSLPQQLIVATHDLSLAARCDRVLVLEGGRVVFDGSAVRGVRFYRESVL